MSSRISSANATARTAAHGIDAGLYTRPAVARLEVPRFTGGIKIHNLFDAGNERDVQNNITSPDYGTFYNPIQRSIGLWIGASRP